ncbi:MAG: DUF2783 domain-containing protein [Gammaproteobacteria bacterium]|nr:MAG: DUF2783 domain-containing protein [Gammaproteobacteria bacterium]
MKEQHKPQNEKNSVQKLILTPNIADPDAFYAELIAMQSHLDDDSAQAAISQLLLVLANHIGDMDVLREALAVVAGEHPAK